jgi:hypothetical protein
LVAVFSRCDEYGCSRSESDEGTSMAALDLKLARVPQLCGLPNFESLGRFLNSPLACKSWQILCLHFLLTTGM